MNTSLPDRPPRKANWLLLGGFVAFCSVLPFWVLVWSSGTPLSSGGRWEATWGTHGVQPGQFHKPRAIAIDGQDRLYIVDKTARIQVFSRDGEVLWHWRTPKWQFGKPTGLSVHPDGTLMVADTHYFRILFYQPDGTLLPERTIGGEFGQQPGQLGLVTDVVADTTGCLYVSEYGEQDRIQKFSSEGEFLFGWGSHGADPGQFARPQALAVDQHNHLWVVDACNDRIQVFDATGESPRLIHIWGRTGSLPGELRYPYSLVLDGDYVYVCEFGNHRIQKFTRDGISIACWGDQGRRSQELFNPWALVQDKAGRLHVLDTYNHRVHRVRF